MASTQQLYTRELSPLELRRNTAYSQYFTQRVPLMRNLFLAHVILGAAIIGLQVGSEFVNNNWVPYETYYSEVWLVGIFMLTGTIGLLKLYCKPQGEDRPMLILLFTTSFMSILFSGILFFYQSSSIRYNLFTCLVAYVQESDSLVLTPNDDGTYHFTQNTVFTDHEMWKRSCGNNPSATVGMGFSIMFLLTMEGCVALVTCVLAYRILMAHPRRKPMRTYNIQQQGLPLGNNQYVTQQQQIGAVPILSTIDLPPAYEKVVQAEKQQTFEQQHV